MNHHAPLEPGRYYHLYQRGNNRERIFFEERNYAHFLKLIDRHLSPVAEVYAYCLLSNHFHLLIRIRDAEQLPEKYLDSSRRLSQPFSNWLNAYSKAINKAYDRTGKLFEERFNRIAVVDETYLIRLVNYLHANPQKHGIVRDFRQYPHSSFRALISHQPTKLQRSEVLDWFGGKAAFLKFHTQYQEHLMEMEGWEEEGG